MSLPRGSRSADAQQPIVEAHHGLGRALLGEEAHGEAAVSGLQEPRHEVLLKGGVRLFRSLFIGREEHFWK